MPSPFESVLKNKNMAHGGKPLGTADAPRQVAFVLMEHFSMMSFTGAVDALVTANLMAAAPLFSVQVVGAREQQVVSDLGIVISADCTLADLAEKQLGLIIVCGGFRVALQADPLLRRKLRAAASVGAGLGGLWNGAYFLAEAGLLDGNACALHPDARAMMAELFPKVTVSNRSYVVADKRLSCAGANSSLPMMLELLQHTASTELVNAVSEVLSCDTRVETPDISVLAVDVDPTRPQALKSALELMRSNIEEPLGTDEIAQCVNLSRRHLERLFCQHMDATPTRYYLELRLTRARQLIQQTNKAIAEVAMATGFLSLSNFQRRFREFFGMAPGMFRAAARGRR